MNISKKLFVFGLILLIFGIIDGVIAREWTRFTFRNVESLEEQILFGFHLFISHGHFILFGLLSLFLSVLYKNQKESSKNFNLFVWFFIVGCTLTLVLSFYKGLFLSALAGTGKVSLFQADEMLFSGNKILRSLAYTIAHVPMGAGIIGLFYKAPRSYNIY